METQNHSVASRIHPGPKLARYFFFVAGLVATVAYRIVPFLAPLQIKIAWYTGTIGFILYFWHRSYVENKRAILVKDYNLVDVVEKSDIQGEEKVAISYLVKTSRTSTARYNSAFILIVSAMALALSIAIDLGFLHL